MQHIDRARSALARLLRGRLAFGHKESRFVDINIVRAHALLASDDANRLTVSNCSESSRCADAPAQPHGSSEVGSHTALLSTCSRPPSPWKLPAPGTACGHVPDSGRGLLGLGQPAAGLSGQPAEWRGLASMAKARTERQSIRLHDLVLPLPNPTVIESFQCLLGHPLVLPR